MRNADLVPQLRRSVLAMSVSAVLAIPALAFAAAEPVTVKRGAEWVSAPSVPDSITVDMRQLPAAPSWKPGDGIREIPRRLKGDPNAPAPIPANPVFGDDPLAAQQRAYDRRSPDAFGTPLVNKDIIASAAVSPNDPTGDIGTLQVVTSINSASGAQFAIYDKVTGNQVGTSALMETLAAGGSCAAGLGDPIILFDELASRWVLTEFTDGANVLCVYLSNTADLSGTVTWTRYSFTLPTFPDYPKYGMWPDAYYVGANENNGLYAMDRQKMLAGQAATLQRFSNSVLSGFGFQMSQPADLAGTTPPPAGSPGIFMRHRDDEVHNAGSNNPNEDYLEMFELRIDWTTPANSALTGPTSIAMPEFSSNINGLSAFSAFPQPNGTKLDPLRETVMHRLTYRNMGTHEVLVGNLVTDLFLGAGSTYPDDTGGIRWFELRRAIGTPDAMFADGFETAVRATNVNPWTLRQAGTYAPADGAPADQADRWMGASAVDQDGNIALGYSLVRQAPAIAASLRYTGRLANDPLGVMTAAETNLVTGSGGVTNTRWGDYHDMGIDPVDGCTFWFVGSYVNGGRANRVASFKFDECGGPSFTMSTPTPAIGVCANSASQTNAPPVTLNLAAVNGFSGTANLSVVAPLPTGIFGSVSPTSVSTYPSSATVQLSATNAATPGVNTITARGVSGAITRNVDIALNVATISPVAPTLTAPANGATAVSTTPTFTWNAVPQAVSYVVEASTSNTFATTLFSQTVTGTSLVSPVALPTNTQVYWRVRAINGCGTGPDAVVSSFTTANILCFTGPLAIPDNTPAGVSANIVVPAGAPVVNGLRISINVTHTYVGDLAFTLSKDGGTAVSVYSPATTCSGDNMAVNVYDAAAGAANTCANATPAVSGDIKPAAVFSGFNGTSATGTWTLKAVDRATIDTGTINSWCINL
ncbi:MAG: proprotein convertase P-domain-containing protein [Lysobacterales bacterium]